MQTGKTLAPPSGMGLFPGTKLTSNICDCTHEYNFEEQGEEHYKQGRANRRALCVSALAEYERQILNMRRCLLQGEFF